MEKIHLNNNLISLYGVSTIVTNPWPKNIEYILDTASTKG